MLFPSRSAIAARQQEPKDVDDFDKREVENCMPYDTCSSFVVKKGWSTRRTYISTEKLQKADVNSPGLANPWQSCHDVAGDVEVRYRRLGDNDTMLDNDESEEPFVKKAATAFNTDGVAFTHNTALKLKRMQNASYKTVGSVLQG
ncbi:unnamed protein product [Peronospora destructor]|uniref:Uncharacterized protein n=1 Tax=Peronospora destructor TaxID=86335 RepID=A0AAV0VBK1_9STRA|nr:unnamed protein product [Peronospora destructor]